MERTTTPPSTSRLENDEEEIPAPTQGDSSVSEYFESIKLYAIAQNEDLDHINIKVAFILGLKLDYAKRAKEFGFEKTLKEIVEHLGR
ncbi:hypothetical protein RclHR1_30590001 [Rhizophagus clarus]|uniref:Uncharacterized protein n=1 Tax=Rhizophagus clarus TaxID=94130 RepID=A0A2Z6R9P0_9GLOM|nr:hypothetical protein RclHR1_30590001 [Rhizophagus clarus]GES76300.1 hypothetical protein GLOIN_2v1829228 [Rhizophagus clarus]